MPPTVIIPHGGKHVISNESHFVCNSEVGGINQGFGNNYKNIFAPLGTKSKK